jgi:hypothetical protein
MQTLAEINATVIFKEGDLVEIHSAGPSLPGTYRAIIRGIGVNWGDSPATIWIVEPIERLPTSMEYGFPEYAYSCCCFPQACLQGLKNES